MSKARLARTLHGRIDAPLPASALRPRQSLATIEPSARAERRAAERRDRVTALPRRR